MLGTRLIKEQSLEHGDPDHIRAGIGTAFSKISQARIGFIRVGNGCVRRIQRVRVSNVAGVKGLIYARGEVSNSNVLITIRILPMLKADKPGT